MTARQQRRLDQKIARKAARRALKDEVPSPVSGPIQLTASEVPAARETAVISQAKLSANRANAQHSTGATTEQGKARVSQNATKHGLTGKFTVLAHESQSEFDQLLAGFLRSEGPADDDEIEMVRQMAEALWLSRRCIRLQNECFQAIDSGTAQEQHAAHRSLTLYMRYQSTQDRTFFRYALELRKRRLERARAATGFVSQQLKEAAERRRQEVHATGQAVQSAKEEGQKIRNRMTAARAEALELKNLARKNSFSAQISQSELVAVVASGQRQ